MELALKSQIIKDKTTSIFFPLDTLKSLYMLLLDCSIILKDSFFKELEENLVPIDF
jgi:hypothetical protein